MHWATDPLGTAIRMKTNMNRGGFLRHFYVRHLTLANGVRTKPGFYTPIPGGAIAPRTVSTSGGAIITIDCDYTPGALSLAVKPRKLRELEHWVRHVTERYGYPLHWIAPGDMDQWIASGRYCGGVADLGAGSLHPLKYSLGLGRAALAAGVRLYEDSPVFVLERGATPVVKTAQGQVRARFVVLAGNVYLAEYGDLAPQLSARIMPVGTYMVATQSMGAARAAALLPQRSAVSDTNFVLDYFRLSADHRLLFGAGDSYS
eukprot:gene27769-28056_t